jgi:hypothetical protein
MEKFVSIVSTLARLPVHPLLLGAAFVLNAAFDGDVSARAIARPLLLVILLGAAATSVAAAAMRSWQRGAVVVSSLLVLLASLDPLRAAIGYVTALVPSPAGLLLSGSALSVSLFMFAAVTLRARRRSGLPIARVSSAANQIAAVLLIVVLATGGLSRLGQPAPVSGNTATLAGGVACGPPADPLPDIYHILLDGYPRADTLADRFAFDDAEFLDGLRDRGFVVNEQSHSNYTFTALTFSSMFNMAYLDQIPDLSQVVGKPMSARRELRSAISHARVFALLREFGYRLVATPSGWDHVSLHDAVDDYLDHGELGDLERNLIERTWLPEVLGAALGDWAVGQERARVEDAFADLGIQANRDDRQPLWVFAHIPLPHLPLVFAGDGQAAHVSSIRQYTAESYQRSSAQYGPRYGDQLQVLNDMVLGVVDQLLQGRRQRPQVIIVMSDHGYTHDVREIDPHDRLSNLFAISAAPPVAGSPTPVNLYRELAATYLGRCFEDLPNRYFISPDPEEQLTYAEVAEPDSHEAVVPR